MPYVIARAKELKRQNPRIKYRNMQIVAADVTDSKVKFTLRGLWSTAGPEM